MIRSLIHVGIAWPRGIKATLIAPEKRAETLRPFERKNCGKAYGAAFGANKLRNAAAMAGSGGRIGGKI